MPAKISLPVTKRSVTGRKVKSIRKQGMIPANVFGKKIKSFAIQVEAKKFESVFSQSGETGLIYLTLEDKKEHPVLITSIQKHAVTGEILHIDFRQVILTEKVKAMIPLELTGEAPAVKDKNGVLVQAVNELEVEALPTDFPDNFTLDISGLLEIGNSLLFKELKYDKSKLTIALNPEDTLVTVKAQEEEKVEEVPVPAEAETEVAPAEGETESASKEGTESEKTEKPKEESKAE